MKFNHMKLSLFLDYRNGNSIWFIPTESNEIELNSFFFGKHLLSAYYILNTLLSTEDLAVNKTDYYKADSNK